MLCANMPVQNLEGKRESIVHRLDEVATCDVCQTLHGINSHSHRLTKSFDMKRCYATTQEKCLTSGSHMPGFHLMLQDDEGQYTNSANMLSNLKGRCLFMTHSAILPNRYLCGEASASLTMMELHTANDLSNMVPLPYEGF